MTIYPSALFDVDLRLVCTRIVLKLIDSVRCFAM